MKKVQLTARMRSFVRNFAGIEYVSLSLRTTQRRFSDKIPFNTTQEQYGKAKQGIWRGKKSSVGVPLCAQKLHDIRPGNRSDPDWLYVDVYRHQR